MRELEQELGLQKDDLSELYLLGQHRDRGWTEGTRITSLARTSLTFEQVVDRWQESRDGWEYTHLLAVPFNLEAVQQLLDTTDFHWLKRVEYQD